MLGTECPQGFAHVRSTGGSPIRILIADDSEAFRCAVKDLLSHDSGEWVVCGEATNGEDAVKDVARLLPDVILLDLSIPDLHGLRVAEIPKKKLSGFGGNTDESAGNFGFITSGRCGGNPVLHSEIPRGAGFSAMLLSVQRNARKRSDLR
jgi:hypothetical protein